MAYILASDVSHETIDKTQNISLKKKLSTSNYDCEIIEVVYNNKQLVLFQIAFKLDLHVTSRGPFVIDSKASIAGGWALQA